MTDDTINLSVSAARVNDGAAKAYRLARCNGELVLQGCFFWRQGSEGGHEWRDIPVVDLDASKAQ